MVADQNPHVTINDGVNLSNVTFDGRQSWCNGTYGLYWSDTTSVQTSFMLSLENIRWEQGQSASAYRVYISRPSTGTLQNLVIRNCNGDVGCNGYYFRYCEDVLLDSVWYPGSTGRTSLNVDGTVSPLTFHNCFWQTGSAYSMSGLTEIYRQGSASTAYPPGIGAWAAAVPNTMYDATVTHLLDMPTGNAAIRGGSLWTLWGGFGSYSNLCLYSEQIDNGGWVKVSASVNADANTAPDGSATADEIEFSSSTGYVIAPRYDTDPLNRTFTASVWLKVPSGTKQVYLKLVAGGGIQIAFSQITVTADWQRFAVTGTSGGSYAGLQFHIQSVNDTKSLNVWGAQLEEASMAGMYVPTGAVIIDKARTGPILRFPVYTFAANDTTPSVAGGRLFKTANRNQTTITMFGGGVVGQQIQVYIDGNTTIDFTGTRLKGNNGADFTDAAGAVLAAWFDGTYWYCIVQGF